MSIDEGLARAAAKLAAALRPNPMFLHIGVVDDGSDPHIVVYVLCDLFHASEFVPPTFEGWSVIARRTTRPRTSRLARR